MAHPSILFSSISMYTTVVTKNKKYSKSYSIDGMAYVGTPVHKLVVGKLKKSSKPRARK